ncbi:MAG TPA: DUF3455 domain-containing protein [Bordetella sp.]|nr:DUF3455 domain-containing protein [Bordetella sp.]
MKRSLHRHIACRSTLAGCIAIATASAAASENVPAVMQVPAGNYVAWRAPAEGVITYACRHSQSDASKLQWVIDGAQAKLGATAGAQGGTYASPPETWRAADGSSLTGIEVVRAPAGADRLYDQLVMANPAGGAGVLSGVTYIQRIVRDGGAAPGSPCDRASLNQRVGVPYRASYVFWKPD